MINKSIYLDNFVLNKFPVRNFDQVFNVKIGVQELPEFLNFGILNFSEIDLIE